MIVTVTMNAALDRILTVPNFQRGHRHRASEKLTLAGGKGIIVARALKRLGVPVVATGLVGGRNGRRILEELTEEAVLNDLVRIDDESRTSTAIIDPTSGTYTEIIEWGPLVDGRARDPAREDRLPVPRRRDGRLRRVASARGRRGFLRRHDPRAQPARHRDDPRLGGRAAAPRHRGGADARLAEPARGRGARRAGVLRRGGLPARARHAQRDGRAQRARHAGPGLLRAAAPEGAGPPDVFPRLAPPSTSCPESARARCCWPPSSPRGSRA